MARPAGRNYTQLPIASYSGWDNAVDVDSILRTHEYGNFRLSSLFADQLLRDDRIYGVTDTRLGGMMGAEIQVKPATGKRKAIKIAETLGGVSEESGIWDKLFPADILAGLWRWGHYTNFGVADIFWEGSKSEWRPRLRLWHPQNVYWSWSTFSYWILTGEGIVELPRVNETPESDGRWILWCPKGYHYGWMHGLVRPLGRLAIMRGWDYRDWARYNEVHGQAIRKAIVPMDAGDVEKDIHFANVAGMGADSTVLLPQEGGEGGRKYDVKYEEAVGRSWEAFKDFKTALDTDIAVVVLGQNLTTEVKGGSYAAAKTHELIRADKKAEDAGILKCLRAQVLTWWALYNYGDEELAPRPEFVLDLPDEENQQATAMKNLGDAIQSLVLADVPVDIRTLADRAGVPMLSEEEVAEQEAEEAADLAENPPPAAAPPGDQQNGVPPKNGVAARARLAAAVVKRYEFQGLQIAVENPVGSVRAWKGHDGTAGATTMHFDYGYLDGHTGADGDEVDVYVGTHADASDVYVVHQTHPPEYKSYDEDKCFLGFRSADDARRAFVAHRSDGDKAIGGMSSIPLDQFKRKLRRRTGTGKIRAVALRRTSAGNRRASRYLLALEENARRRAAAALAPDLAVVKRAVDEATDAHDLRRRLLLVYRNMSPVAFQDIVGKAHVMAQLAGRGEALEEV